MKRIKKKDYNYHTGKRYDNIMGRCYRETDKAYKNYGALGIKVCSHWISDINNFRTWFTKELNKNGITQEEFLKNTKKIQLDRIDPYGHYTPENCRLTSPQKNSRNKKINRGKKIVSSEGEEHEF